MKKTIIFAMAALMLLSAQCKKNEQKPEDQEEMVMVPIHGTMSFDVNDSKTEITTAGYVTPMDGDKIYIYYDGTYKGYLTCTPTTGQQFDCEGMIDETCKEKTCVFMYLGSNNGLTGTSTSVSFADQTAIGVADGKIKNVNKFHVGSCKAKVSAEGAVVLPMLTKMAIGYFQLKDESDNPVVGTAEDPITISGLYHTASFDRAKGTLSCVDSNLGDITVKTDAQGRFYVAMIPQSGAVGFIFASVDKEGTKNFPNGIRACRLYTEDGISSPIVVTMGRPLPDAPSSVATISGCTSDCSNVVGGTFTITEAQEVEYGFVYSQTETVPEVGKDNCTKFVGNTESLPAGTKSFTIDLTGLTTDVYYYVRAYAIGENGTVVHAPNSSAGIKRILGGNTPQALPSDWINGTNPHPFTVASGITVQFSQGNLQYIGSASTPYWKFAEHQFDFLGTTTGQNLATETVDRDLFGWGTSGQAHGATCYQPWSTSTSYNSYYAYGNRLKNLCDYPGTADWGYNDISNDGSHGANQWRTLTQAEWGYLINTRTNASKLYGMGKLGDCTYGLIILPDDWSLPAGLSFVSGATSWKNKYSYSEWSMMEAAGAVFLPVAGGRKGTSLSNVGSYGNYWSSSYKDSTDSYYLYFKSGSVSPQYDDYRYYGFSVRLVRSDANTSAGDFESGSW